MNPNVDFYFEKAGRWQKETEYLRKLVLSCGLQEELKWGCPCYTHNGRNIVLIHDFKDYCALLLFQGALLKDEEGLLVQQTANVQAARQLRFTSLAEVKARQAAVKAYVFEAIEVERAGLRVPLKKTTEFPMAEEFQQELAGDAALKAAFEALTP
ncbi:MAG: hypothetical protein EOO12_14515, partial [Chitinophagaceae bacterium]